MSIRRALTAGLAACALAVGTWGTSQAQLTTTFAQFKQQSPAIKGFEYNAAGFHVNPSPLPVFFNYGVANHYDDVINASVFGGNINAFMTLNTTKIGGTAVNGTFLSQMLNVVTMSFTLDTTGLTAAQLLALGGTNLLTVTGTAMLSGPNGSQTPSMNADTNTGFTIVYSSSFLNFPAAIVSEDYNLSFSGATPALGLNGSGQLRNFVTSGTGTFDYSTVPEGNSLLFLAMGLIPVAALFAYRRRQTGLSN
jgi:hypothetical protein